MNFIEFASQREQQVSKVESVLIFMHHMGLNPDYMPVKQLADYLEAEDRVPAGIEPIRFAAMVKSRAGEGFNPEQDIRRNWNVKQMENYAI